MGAKLGVVLVARTDLPAADVLSLVASLCAEAQTPLADVYYHPRVELTELLHQPPRPLQVGFLAVRAASRHPGITAIAERCSEVFATEAMASNVNDYYQSGGFQVWGRTPAGLHIDGGLKIGERSLSYRDATLIGLGYMFGDPYRRQLEGVEDEEGQPVFVEEHAPLTLVAKAGLTFTEDICALTDGPPGADSRVVEDGKVLSPPRALELDEGLDWEWNSTPMEWPMLVVPARRRLKERRRA